MLSSSINEEETVLESTGMLLKQNMTTNERVIAFQSKTLRELRSVMSFKRLMFSRSGLFSRFLQLGVELISRSLDLLGAHNTAMTIRQKRLTAVASYREKCESLLSSAVQSGFFEVYVDLGAHIGEQVIEICPYMPVIAFEPDPRAFDSLSQRVSLIVESERHEVRLFQLAISDSNGRMELHYSDSRPGKTGGSTIEGTKRGFSGKHSVSVDTLDVIDMLKLVDNVGKAIFKIDIEGAEYRVIKRLAKLRRLGKLGLVLVEFHETKMKFGRLRGTLLTLYCWMNLVRRSKILEWY